MDGKKIRGLSTVHAFHQLCPPQERTESNLKLASILGWCVEMVIFIPINNNDIDIKSWILLSIFISKLQAFYLIHDDIIDNTNVRRGRPCWHRLDNNGLHAINDAVILDKGVYLILKKNFKNRPCYVPILETFQEVRKFNV